jgi:iron complex transport system ATP-binding protein
MTETRLRAAEVSFAYFGGRPVLQDVSAVVRRGGLVGILGPNGSGKTTLLRLLGGLLRPGGGRVTLDGVDLAAIRRADAARRIAMVPQETQLAFEYTVLEMATMGRYPHLRAFAIEGPGDLEIAREALRVTGTLELASRPFNTLSGGEKQRVVIAGALAQAPEVLLLDEPTASLDLAYQVEVRSILRTLNAERGLTIVVSTHDLNLAAALCDEIILLDRGRVLAFGPTRAMLDPSLVRRLYGVEVDISIGERTGQVTIVPVARVSRNLPS